MGGVGRIIEDGDFPHGADWNALVSAAAGAGYVIEGAEPTKTTYYQDEYEVTVGSGTVCLGLPRVDQVEAETVHLEPHGEDKERYDLLYFGWVEDEDIARLKVKTGKPESENALHKDIPADAAPIAVVYFGPGAEDITQIKDCRALVDPRHEHVEGAALGLNDDMLLMDVIPDDETVEVSTDKLTLKAGGITPDMIDILWGGGIKMEEVMDGDEVTEYKLHVDEDFALEFDADDRLIVDPYGFTGTAMFTDSDQLVMNVIEGDGIKTATDEALMIDTGDGSTLVGMSPNKELEADPGHGLGFETGKLKVTPADFAGDGLEEVSGDLKVKAGNGLDLTTDLLTAETGLGTAINSNDRIIADAGHGVSFDDVSVGRLQLDVGDIAGDGLKEDGGEIDVAAGNGLQIVSGRVDVKCGRGIRTNNPGGEVTGEYLLEAHVDPDGGIYGEVLKIDPSKFAGDGLTVDGLGDLTVSVGDGVKIDSDDKAAVDTGNGITIDGDGKVREDGSRLAGRGIRYVSDCFSFQMEELFEVIREQSLTIGPDETKGVELGNIGGPVHTIHPVYTSEKPATGGPDNLPGVNWWLEEPDDGEEGAVWLYRENVSDAYDLEVYERVYKINIGGSYPLP